jgi:uncharacterized protein YndB with AHSA1/START domain
MKPSQKQGSLRLSRTFSVPRERIFRAWTSPEELKKWWLLGQGWRLNVVEVDLRVEGHFRIGLVSTENEMKHEVSGSFKEISEPDRLVYTWNVKDSQGRDEESLVTVEFHPVSISTTELVLTHDHIETKESRQNTYDGWIMVLDGLRRLLGSD